MRELTHLSLFSGIGVPQQFYPIFAGIAELEEMYEN